MDLYDVVGVALKNLGDDRPRNSVRIMGAEKDKENADAFMKMAVIRRGVEDEFFAVVKHGSYREGSQWKGKR